MEHSDGVQCCLIYTHRRKLIYETESLGSAVTALAQSPALDIIGIGLHSGQIHIRNLRTDITLLTFSQPQPVQSLSFRTDGQPLMASSSPTGRISVFDLNKRRNIHTLETSATSQIVNLAFLPGQPLLLTTSKDNSVKLFLFEESGPRLLRSRSGHSSPPTKIHTHTSKWLLSASGNSLRAQSLFNDSQSFEFSQTALMEGYAKMAAGQGYSSSRLGDIIAIGSSTTRENEWDAVITASRGEKGARTWSWKRRTIGDHLLHTQDQTSATAACVSFCGNFGVVGTEKGNVEAFNMQSGIKRKRFAKGHTRSVTFVALDRLNKTLVSAGSDGLVLLWDFKTSTIKGQIDLGSAVTIGKMQNGLVALSCDDLSIRVLDCETPSGRVVRELWGHSNRITDFVFSPTSTWIISLSLDSTLRVWDLPTGFLISAVRLPSIATAIAFSPSGEFLATAHVGSLGIHLWSNRSQFRTIPVRRINEEDIPSLGETLPSISGRQGEGVLEGAFDEEDISEDEDISGMSTVDQLSEELLTMSLQPRQKMWSLLNLEAIRRRNRAREPIKQPEKAPFFLPSLKDSTKTREGVEQPALKPITDDAPKSRIIRLQDNQVESEFTRLLNSDDHEELIQHMTTLTPSQLDYHLRTMNLLSPYTEPITYVKAMIEHLRTKRDFELVQAWMLAFLRIQQDWLVQVRDEEGIREVMKEWEEAHRTERERIAEIVGYVGGVLGFIRGI